MANYAEFSRELGHMPKNRRSSLIEANESYRCGADNSCSTPKRTCGRRANNQSYVDSPYPFVQVPGRPQRNFEIYEDTPAPPVRGANLRARYIDPGCSDSRLVTPDRGTGHPMTATVCRRMPASQGFGQRLNMSDPYNETAGGRTITQADFGGSEFHNQATSRRQIDSFDDQAQNVRAQADFGGGKNSSIQMPSEVHHVSGCPLSSNGRGLRNSRGLSLPVNVSHVGVSTSQGPYGTGSRSLTPADFGGGRSQNLQGHENRVVNIEVQVEAGDVSGRATDLSGTFGNRTLNISENSPIVIAYQTSGRDMNPSDFAGGTARNVSVPPEPYNASGRPYTIGDLTVRIPSIQIQSDSYGSGRPLNLSDLGTTRLQEPYNASGRPLDPGMMFQLGEQYLQVPREQYGQLQAIQGPCEQYEQSGRPFSAAQLSMSQANDSCGVQSGPESTMLLSRSQAIQTSETRNVCPSVQFSEPLCQPCPPCPPCPPCSSADPLHGEAPQSSRQGVRGVCPMNSTLCPNLSQDRLVQFLLSGKPPSSTSRGPLFSMLVKDNYFPGAIEDTVNGRIDFNRIAFDATFDGDNIPKELEPEDVPLTLLEAFEQRIVYENELLENLERRKEFCLKEQKNDAKLAKKNPGTGERATNSEVQPEVPTEEAQFWTHRDELKLASTIDIDLTSTIRDHPESGLTEALACLFKAEKMNAYDKRVHVAEAAIRTAPPHNHEKAALKSTCTFQIDMQKTEGKSHKTYHPIEIVSYVGTTKPSEGQN